MAVGAHQAVGEEKLLSVLHFRTDHLGQELQVHLVHDTGSRRHHAEIIEGTLSPAQELVAFAIALEFQLGVLGHGLIVAVEIDLHRVVHNQIHRHTGIHTGWIATRAGHGTAQRGQVDNAGHAGEVLQDHTRGTERNFVFTGALGAPGGDAFHIFAADLESVL